MRSSVAPQRSGLHHQYDADDNDEEGEGEGEYMEEDEDEENEGAHAEDDPDAMYDDDDESYEDDENMDDYENTLPKRNNVSGYDQRAESELSISTPGSLKRSRGMNDSLAKSTSQPKISPYEKVAKGLYTRMPAPGVEEDDDLILDTEATVSRLYDNGIAGDLDEDDQIREALAIVPNELINLWADYDSKTTVPKSGEYTATIGPGPTATNFAKANFVAGLTLQVQHPKKQSNSFDSKVDPLPQILLAWTEKHHNPYPEQFNDVQSHHPSPSNHQLFWDTIFNCLIRGKVTSVADVLDRAGWHYARNDADAPRVPFAPTGFSGIALANIEKVVSAAVIVLRSCPGHAGDWHLRSSDWTLFRLRASTALEDLRTFAEGRNRDRHAKANAGSYSKAVQKAESKVPWHIYQNLVIVYSILMGDASAIIESAEDWLEATIGLMAWWDEGKDERRLAMGRSQTAYRAAARETDEQAFRRKLRRSFGMATAESTDFAVNSANEIEVALASLFEEDYASVIGFLRGWSGPVSSATAEVASLAGWLPQVEEKSLINMGSLDQDDMDLLGLNASPSKVDGVKDQTLITYARALARIGELRSSSSSGRPQVVRQGWEISLALFGRLDSTERSDEMVTSFLEGFKLDSSSTVDKLWTLLNDIALDRHAETVAEVRRINRNREQC